jgi:hypothetical protein
MPSSVVLPQFFPTLVFSLAPFFPMFSNASLGSFYNAALSSRKYPCPCCTYNVEVFSLSSVGQRNINLFFIWRKISDEINLHIFFGPEFIWIYLFQQKFEDQLVKDLFFSLTIQKCNFLLHFLGLKILCNIFTSANVYLPIINNEWWDIVVLIEHVSDHHWTIWHIIKIHWNQLFLTLIYLLVVFSSWVDATVQRYSYYYLMLYSMYM